MKGKTGTWLRVGISVGLMVTLLWGLVDWREAWQVLKGCRWEFLALLALWITLDRLVMTYKWRLLILCRGMKLGIGAALKAYYVSTFAGSFLPSTVGADAMRAASVSGPGRPSDLVFASIVMERALGFLAAAVAAGLALILLAGLAVDLPPQLLWVSLGVLAAVTLAVVFSLSGWLGDRLGALKERLEGKGKIAGWVGRFLAAYAEYRHHRGTLAWFLVVSVLEQSVPVVGTWLTALAFNIDLTLLESTAVAPLALMFTRLPVSLSGFGVVEGLYVAFFALVGLSPTDSFILGLVANLSVVVTTLPGAALMGLGGFKVKTAA